MPETDEETMNDDSHTHTKPVGIFVTLREIHGTVMKIDEKLDAEIGKLREELAKVRSQLAAQWVVHGIMIATVVFLIQRGLS